MKASALVAACYDAACRPPSSGGSGGSLPARGGVSAKRAAALADSLGKPSGGLLNQAIFLLEGGVVEYLSEGEKWNTQITPEMVRGIHPVDLYHVLGNEGYADNQVGLGEGGRPGLSPQDIVRHLTGYDVVTDMKAFDNGKSVGPNTPNGQPNFKRAVRAKK